MKRFSYDGRTWWVECSSDKNVTITFPPCIGSHPDSLYIDVRVGVLHLFH